jgi:hypothetical protein
MVSSIGWVVHDRDEEDRINRVLAALNQSEARDELGLGGIRDSLADSLFPGTSTIQTRLRYFLIVPWCYRAIETQKVPSPKFGRQVLELERSLIGPLLDGEDSAGAFGAIGGARIKRLPSSVYWSGLQAWGIRRERVSQAQYHRSIDSYYRQSQQVRETDDGERVRVLPQMIWHSALPEAPPGFPNKLDLKVTRDEGEFLLERLQSAQSNSLLAWLARNAPDAKAAFPWEHPRVANFPATARELIEHARLLSEVTWGASLLYNRMLAELPATTKGEQERQNVIAEERGADLDTWRKDILRKDAVRYWKLDRLRELCRVTGHNVTEPTWSFCKAWIDRVLATTGFVEKDEAARELVRKREKDLKTGGRSRFANPALRLSWNGLAGTGRLTFRWRTVEGLLSDLSAAIGGSAK